MKPLVEFIEKVDIGAHLLDSCNVPKDEFIKTLKVDTFYYRTSVLDYDNNTGELTVKFTPLVCYN